MKQVYLKILFSLLMAVVGLPAISSPWNPEDGGNPYDNPDYVKKLDSQYIVVDGLKYYCSSDGTAIILQGEYYGDVVIRESVEKYGKTYRVTSIDTKAFEGCTGLTSVTIPDSVKIIGYEAFEGCTGLTSVTIPDSVTKIDYGTFRDCTGLTSVTIPDSVTEIGPSAFEGCTGLTSVTIPDSVTEIWTSTFEGCTGLTSVTIPDSVTEIWTSAFKGCTGLTSVTIPDSVTKIGSYAFNGCTGLTSVTIPDSVTKIGSYAFNGCTGLTSVSIPDSVTEIGPSAFEGCTSLTSVTIPDSVTDISVHVFKDCTSLNSAFLGNSLTEIKIYLIFDGCNNLKLLSLGNAVSKIYGLFYSDIHTLICHTVVPPSISDVVFPDKEILPKTIYVPAESVKTYKYTVSWERYADSIMPIEASSADVLPDDDKDYTITGNIVSFDAEAGTPVNIYSIDGVLRYQGSGPAEVELPEGLYILRIGNLSRRIRL